MMQLYALPSEPGRADPLDEHDPACDCASCENERALDDDSDAYFDSED